MKSRLWVGLALAVMGLYRCTSVIRMVISSNSLFGKSSSCLKQKGGGALHCRRLMMARTRLANAAALALIRLTNAAAQLPYGSGETKGVLLLRSQTERKAASAYALRQVEEDGRIFSWCIYRSFIRQRPLRQAYETTQIPLFCTAECWRSAGTLS